MSQRKITSASIANDAVASDQLAANIQLTGTYVKVPVGTTAQRPVSPEVGQLRYNTDLGNLEQFTGNAWGSIAPPPAISGVSPSSYNGNAGTQFTITGVAFGADATVKFITNNGTEYTASSVSRVSSTELLVTTPQDFTVADEPLDVKIIQGSGTAIVENVIDCGGVPVWTTSSGSLGVVNEKTSASLTVVATDPEDGSVTYTVENGSTLPSGLSLNASSGVISGTMPDISNDTTYNFTLGATDAGSNKTTRSFSISSYAGDDYWKNTTVLLKGVGSGNQATMLDSSSVNSSISIGGYVNQNKFSPYNSGWSTYFDNQSSQYLTITDPSNHFDFGSGDFTIESWCFANSYKNSFARPWGFAVEGTSTGSGIGLFYTTDKNGEVVYIRSQTTGDAARTINSPTGKWFHLALVRDGGTIRLYQNGSQVGTVSISGALYYNNRFRIGASNTTSPTEFWDGYISNMRIVKGTCLYPSGTTFTPPTSKLTAVSGTVLLTCQDNRIIDNSPVGHAISLGNSPISTSLTPFGQTVNDTTGAVYFPANGAYIQAPAAAVSGITNNQFTIECWVYPETFGVESLFRRIWSIGSSLSNDLTINMNTSGVPVVRINDGVVIENGQLKLNQWNHVVLSRNSSNLLKLHVNGTLVGSTTNSTNFATQSSSGIRIGNEAGRADGTFLGHFADFRVVTGSDVYGSSNLTPPSEPLQAISGTTLLLRCNNGKFIDLTGNTTAWIVGNAAATTAVTKYGNASTVYGGNGDYYSLYNTTPYNITNWLNTETVTRNGTIETWAYLRSLQSSPAEPYLYRSLLSRGDTYLNFGVHGNGKLCWYWYNTSSGQNFSYSTNTVPLNQWVHLALTFNSGNVYFWINGVANGSATFNGIAYGATARDASGGNVHGIGQVWNRPTSSWDGYIDEFRITPGYVRYSSNFTPPTRYLSNFNG